VNEPKYSNTKKRDLRFEVLMAVKIDVDAGLLGCNIM
jgi:hypothetical protein